MSVYENLSKEVKKPELSTLKLIDNTYVYVLSSSWDKLSHNFCGLYYYKEAHLNITDLKQYESHANKHFPIGKHDKQL